MPTYSMTAATAAVTARQLRMQVSRLGRTSIVSSTRPRTRPSSSSSSSSGSGRLTLRHQSNSSNTSTSTLPPTPSHTPCLPPRTHTASDLGPVLHGEKVTLCGWLVQSRTPSSTLSFHPLRDSTGTVQLVVEGSASCKTSKQPLSSLPRESVVHVQGIVRKRPIEGLRSQDTSPTAEVEILVENWTLLNPATTNLPFHPSDEYKLPNDDFRAKYRYLDLRRPALTHNIRLRSTIAHTVRCSLHDQGFTEIETPLLLRSTPEGAREFLVPTRVPTPTSPPSFYALPQSPQQPKQLLIASGVTDKYFQVAKCFRDEAGRKDRQPEFTQLDVEMAFVDGAPRDANSTWRMGGEQVRRTIEKLVQDIWKQAKGVDVLRDAPGGEFPVMTYDEAMSVYGSDKPDTRFGLNVVDLTPYIQSSEVDADTDADANPQEDKTIVEILAFRAPKQKHNSSNSSNSAFSNTEMKNLTKDLHPGPDPRASFVGRYKSPTPSPHALANLLLQQSPHLRNYLERSGISPQDVDAQKLAEGVQLALERSKFTLASSMDEYKDETHLFISTQADPPVGGSTQLGDVRLRLRDGILSKNLAALPSTPHFLWITEFPLFTQSDAEKSSLTGGNRWCSTHHPFTAPSHTSLPLLLSHLSSATPSPSSPLLSQIKGQHYDLVLNGCEIGGGSVRIHSSSLQRSILSSILQLNSNEISRFNHLLNALDSGCPPHAGIALGFDRLMTFLTREECKSIRDVIAFPKSTAGRDMMFAAPASFEGEHEVREWKVATGLRDGQGGDEK